MKIILALAVLLVPGAALAGTLVAEVFTAQTSTCAYQPQGDQEIKDILAQYPDVLVITCHDSYLAEPDLTPGEKEAFGGYCSKRKVEYAGFHAIYTFNIPLVMVNGHYDLNASYPGQIPAGIAMARQNTQVVAFEVSASDNNMLQASLPSLPEGSAGGHYAIRLVAYRPETDTRPEDLMGIVNPITAVRELGAWDGRAQSLSVPIDGLEKRAFAVIVQENVYGPIIAAGKIEKL